VRGNPPASACCSGLLVLVDRKACTCEQHCSALRWQPASRWAATPTPTPAATQDNDHTGRYGLIGLSGLLGLFGYKKYQDLRTSRTSSRGGPIGGVDIDGSGSRRV